MKQCADDKPAAELLSGEGFNFVLVTREHHSVLVLLLATLFIEPTLARLLFLELHVGKYSGCWQTAT